MSINRRHMALAGAVALSAIALDFRPARAEATKDEAAVARAVEEFRAAMMAADRRAFERLCAAQLSYGHSAGKIEDQAEFIGSAGNGKSVWKFITLSNQTLRIVGDDAIVRHVLTGETDSDGKITQIHIGILMVWQKQAGDWKLLARQAVKL